MQVGLVERVRRPGQRSTYYRLRPGSWGAIFERRLDAIRSMRELAGEGLGVCPRGAAGGRGRGGDAAASRGRGHEDGAPEDLRLEEVLKYCDFVEREFEHLMERWEKERDKWKVE